MNKKLKCKTHNKVHTTQKMIHIIKLKNQNVSKYQLSSEDLIDFHFTLTDKNILKLYYFIISYFWLKTEYEDSNIPLKGVIILKAYSTTL